MNTQKGFISLGILLTILLGVVVVGGGAYYLMNQSPQPQGSVNQGQANTQSIPETAPPKTTQANATTATQLPEGSIITISSPSAGSVLAAGQKTTVRWSIPAATLNSFPSDFNLNVFLYVQKQGDPDGLHASNISDGQSAKAGSALWDIPAYVANGQLSPGTYRIVAQFQAVPKDPARLCAIQQGKDCSPGAADAAVISRGSQIKGASGWFTIQ